MAIFSSSVKATPAVFSPSRRQGEGGRRQPADAD
jgi:hypothetical protein